MDLLTLWLGNPIMGATCSCMVEQVRKTKRVRILYVKNDLYHEAQHKSLQYDDLTSATTILQSLSFLYPSVLVYRPGTSATTILQSMYGSSSEH